MSSKDVYATDGQYGYAFKLDGVFGGSPSSSLGVSPGLTFSFPWVAIFLYAPRHVHGCGHETRHPQHDDPN